MQTNLQDLIDTLESISEEYERTACTPTFAGFSEYLVEECGITDKLEIVDRSKWTKFVLSRD